MITYSKIVKYLDQNVVDTLKKEVQLNNNLWGDHGTPFNEGKKVYRYNGPLRHGKTIWLQSVSDDFIRQSGCINLFPETLKIINELSAGNDYARCYWHLLSPGTKIDPHFDDTAYHAKISNRYQIYLDIPKETKIVIDEKLQENSKLQNCILDFNMWLTHAYENNSNQDLLFAVIDILPPGIKKLVA
jgi:hypothetical protein